MVNRNQIVFKVDCPPPRERVLDEKARGHKVIGCLPILIPEELVHASGAFPVGIWGAERLPIVRAAEYYPPYACSVVQSITELAIAAAKEYARVKQSIRMMTVACLAFTLAAWAAVLLFPHRFIRGRRRRRGAGPRGPE